MPPTTPALIPPYFDLLAVRGITGAITSNLLAAGGTEGPLGTVQMPRPKSADTPVDRFEPRKVIEPEPRIEPRQVHRPQAKVEVEIEPTPVVREGESTPMVWNELPAVQEPQPLTDTKSKVESAYRPPIAGHGTLIDQFL